MLNIDLNPDVNKTPPDPRTLLPGQVRGYTRKSNKEGTRSQKSIEDQTSTCLFAAQVQGLPLTGAEVLKEEIGCKATWWWEHGGLNGLEQPDPNRKTRPVLTKLLHDVRDGKVKCIVVWNLDRLFRDVEIAKSLLMFLFRHDCLLYDYDGACNIWTHTGRNAILQNAIASQALSENSRINSPRGVRENIKQDKLVVSCNVLGFRSAGSRTGKVTHIEDEQALVLRIYQMSDSGLSTLQIANQLMSEGIRLYEHSAGQNPHGHKRTEANRSRIYMGSIRDILKDVRYIGMQRWKGDVYPCPVFLRQVILNGESVEETVVPLDLWDRVQSKLRTRKRSGNHSVRMLASLVRCGIDGTVMTAQNTKYPNGEIISHWIIKTHNRRLVESIPNAESDPFGYICDHRLPSLRAPVLDDYIIDVLGPLMAADIREQQEAAEGNAHAASRSIIEKAIAGAERYRREELPKFAISNLITPTLLASMEREVSEKIVKLHEELGLLKDNEQDRAGLVKTLVCLRDIDEAARRDAVRKCIMWVAFFATPGERDLKPQYKCSGYTYAPTTVGKVVFCTEHGTYHTAVIYRERKTDGGRSHKPFQLRPALLGETIGGVIDFPEPFRFVQGLRNAWEGRVYDWSPEQFAPNYVPGAEINLPEFMLEDGGDVVLTYVKREDNDLPNAA